MLEAITRLLAAWRLRRWDATRRRRAADRDADARRREDAVAYERAHYQERLDLARKLLAKAPGFAVTERGRWACETYGRWPIVARLAIDKRGRLWALTERHWFCALPDRPMDTAEALASTFSTSILRAAVRFMEPRVFWLQALQEEVLHYLGFRGRPV